MCKYAKIIPMAALVALLVMKVASAAQFSGELTVKNLQFHENKDRVYRLQQYSAMPKYLSVSSASLNLGDMWFVNNISLSGTGIGEDDTADRVSFDLGNLASLNGEYVKTPHIISSLYRTDRVKETHSIELLKNGPVSLHASESFEDKTGQLENLMMIGQKFETKSAGADLSLGMLSVSVDTGENKLLTSYNVPPAQSVDTESAAVSLNPSSMVYAVANYSKDEYNDVPQASKGNKKDGRKMDVSTAFSIWKNLNVAATFSQDEKNFASNNGLTTFIDDKSIKDTMMTASLNYYVRHGRLGLTYKDTDRDYTNADVSTTNTKSYRVNGSTRMSFLNLSGSFDHTYRTHSRVTVINPRVAKVVNLEASGGEFAKSNVSISLVGFKNFGMTVYASKDYKRYQTYTEISKNTTSGAEGFSSYYIANSCLSFNLTSELIRSAFDETWGIGDRLLLLNGYDDVSHDYSKTNQIGATLALNPNSTLSLNYVSTRSRVEYNIQAIIDKDNNGNTIIVIPAGVQNNKIKENELSLELDRTLSQSLSMNLGLTFNTFIDDLDTSYQKTNLLYEMGLTKKF